MKRLLATLFCAGHAVREASAQAAARPDAYPSGPISLVVCYTPGGATDLQARLPPLWPKIRNIASPSSSSTSPARAA